MSETQTRSGDPRRIVLASEAPFQLGEMQVRPAAREIFVAGKNQVLQPRVMQVLVALARRQGEVVSRDELVASCWDGLSVGEDSISRCIAALRRLSEQDGSAFGIETIPRVGYRIIDQGKGDEPAGAHDAAASAVSIAVLPFVNMSSDPEQEYFSDGLSEELLNQLAQMQELRVVGRTSSFAFKGKNEDLRLIGQKLGVEHVLEGSVRKSGGRVRITAQLVNCADGYHLWSQSYDRELNDVFAIQEDVARAVTNALGATLGVGDARPAVGDTSNVEAYDKFLRARSLTNQMGTANLERAISLYRQALALDPGFTRVLGSLIQALNNYATAEPRYRAETLEEVNAIYERVIASGTNQWYILGLRGMQLQHRRDYLGAEPLIDEAARMAPQELATNGYRAWLLEALCRFDEAIEQYRPIVRQDPLSLVVSFMFQGRLDAGGKHEEALAEYERSKDLAGDRGMVEFLAFLRSWAYGKPDDIKSQYQTFLKSRGPEMRVGLFDQLEPVLFDHEAARAILVNASADSANQNVTRLVQITLLAGAFGATEISLASARRAFIDMNFRPQRFLWLPVLAQVRKDPGFKQIVRDLGLYDYWRQTGKWGEFARPVGPDDFEVFR